MSSPEFVDVAAAILVYAGFELELDCMLYAVRQLLLNCHIGLVGAELVQSPSSISSAIFMDCYQSASVLFLKGHSQEN